MAHTGTTLGGFTKDTLVKTRNEREVGRKLAIPKGNLHWKYSLTRNK